MAVPISADMRKNCGHTRAWRYEGGAYVTVKKIWDGAAAVLIAVTVLLVLILLGGRLLGFQNYIVLSGSMEPAYHVGSLVYVRSVEADELKEGDAITFRLSEDAMATHRIIEVIDDGEDVWFRTKGDANDTEDGNLVPASDVVGEVAFTIPYLGYLASLLQTRAGKAAVIAYGAFLLLMLLLPELIFGGEKDQDKEKNEGDGLEKAEM